jgi:mono/diheme cytochrome c family protein
MNKKSAKSKPVSERLKEKLPVLLVLGVVVGGAWVMINDSMDKGSAAGNIDVKVPQLSTVGVQGEQAFIENCTACHGENAGGGPGGPPLVHKLYNPGHHADGAFFIALKRGVTQHHWRFGNMPPQPQVSAAETKAIIRYVRELQAANGIGR